MKKLIIGCIIGVLLTLTAMAVYAQVRSAEFIFNDVWTDATNSLTIIGV